MLRQIYCLAWVFGVCLLQLQAELPAMRWGVGLFPAAAGLFFYAYCYPNTFPAFRKISSVSLFFGLGFFWAAMFAHWRVADALPHEWEGRDIELIGVIAELPQIMDRSVRFRFDVERVLTAEATVPAHILLTWYKMDGKYDAIQSATLPEIHAGERWQLTVRLKRPHGHANPHGSDFEAKAIERNIRAIGYIRKSADNVHLDAWVNHPQYLIEQVRQQIRTRFSQNLTDHAYAGIQIALAIGDQQAIPQEQWQIFTRTGTNHLMSISGLHVTMVSGMVFGVIYWLWRRSLRLSYWLPARKMAVAAGVLAALCYALLAGFSVPTRRTFVMLAIIAMALWSDRRVSMPAVLVGALWIVVVFDPWAVISPGFWLSFGAIALITLVTFGRIGKAGAIISWARVQWVITLGLSPLLLVLFQQVSLIAPIANAIAIPLVSLVIVPLTLLAVVPFFDFLLLPAHEILSAGMQLLKWLSESPQAVWQQPAPSLWALVTGMAGILWLFLPGGSGIGIFSGFPARWLGMVALLPLFMVTPPKPATGELWLTMLDVGQGLAVVARTEHHTLLYDTGPNYGETDSGARIIVPFLRGEGIRQLDLMLVSHADSDHSGGALSVLAAIPVTSLLSSLNSDHPIQQAARNSQPCHAGDSWQWDDVHFEVLHPHSLAQSDHLAKRKTNETSCVLKITTRHGSVLLPADIEKDTEQSLLARASRQLSATVLIAPHHGSKTSSTEAFIRQVNPWLTLFSVGYRNHFGHPNEQVVERYRNLGSQMMRSDRDGAVLLQFKDNGITVASWREMNERYWHDH
ncbi:DNA internalization-related competence protein ComEC/Rec2 [Nitrosomonas sp. Nm34]|uniref:DNA internalization-related competence protein ComEC/Rec2 n=1 Tax=Nitrosomonas sp. Nm34 TaxID=1881055 RepID=UPI0008EC40D4|nr:DNA internalization-related competence protein ComEC/Rec2 [Nitrosomonas sp. Nm34]SFI85339.1 competence protein ComEC [Nitrosomonas sp. Nm34]